MPSNFFLWNSIPNIIIIVGLIFYLYKRKSIMAVLVAMFSYLSLHGGYAVFAAATGDGINTLNTLHYENSDQGVKLVGACFLAYCSALLCLRMRMKNPVWAIRSSILSRPALALLPIFFLACMSFSASNHVEMDSGQFYTAMKESIFAACMWAGAIIFAIVIKLGFEYFDHYRKDWLIALLVLTLLMIGSGFYEIVTGVIWAGTYYSFGFSYRSSGTLFNPNVLGFWCSLMAALISLLFHLQWISRRATFGGMMAVICLLVMSSSRGGLMLSILNLAVVTLVLFLSRKLVQKNMFDQSWPFCAFVLTFAVFAVVIDSSSPSRYLAVNTFYANMHRFLQLPGDIFWILNIKIILPLLQKLNAFSVYFLEPLAENNLILKNSIFFFSNAAHKIENILLIYSAYEPQKTMESLNGRVSSQYTSDNSFTSIYAIGGPVSLSFWLCQWSILFWIGIKKCITSPGVLSAHALGALVLCFASGFFLRTPQLFPIWIFLAMVLGACLCWWSIASDLTKTRPGKLPKFH